MGNRKPSEASRKKLGIAIDAERRERGMSFAQLAKKAGCDEKTVRKLVNGDSTRDRTLFEVCAALGIDRHTAKLNVISDEEHGGYTLEGLSEYVGRFFAYRRSQSFPKNILRSVFDISWKKDRRCFWFDETQRYHSAETNADIDNSQSGEVFISQTIGLIHLLSKFKGAVRLITISKFRLNNPTDYTMHGIVLTQAKRPFHYQPFSAAIIFEKIPAPTKDETTVIRPDDPNHSAIDQNLTYVERHMVTFALAPPFDPSAVGNESSSPREG